MYSIFRSIDRRIEETLAAIPSSRAVSVQVVHPDGRKTRFGDGGDLFEIVLHDAEGEAAFSSLTGLAISEAYVAGHLDLKGDLVRMLVVQDLLPDPYLLIRAWSRLSPILFSRARLNRGWIARHYDAHNLQRFAAEPRYFTYTPGIYHSAGDTMEDGAERKLAWAYEQLGLTSGQRLLDIGCGWGGFLRYAAKRGVACTGITLSSHQRDWARSALARDGLEADVRLEDFFTFAPKEPFDAVSMMGVIEDLSDYPRVMHRLSRLVRPGGRVYLDFGAKRTRFGTHSFITKHIWPGTFRLVYMPEFVDAMRCSPFELVRLETDRENYRRWARWLYDRWEQNELEVIADGGQELYRLYRVLFATTSAFMDLPSYAATAFRVVLEHPEDLRPPRRRSLADTLRHARVRIEDARDLWLAARRSWD